MTREIPSLRTERERQGHPTVYSGDSNYNPNMGQPIVQVIE